MKNNSNVQPGGPTDVRSSKKLNKRARIGLTIAGTGCASAMLLGGLFGGHASAAPMQAASMAQTNAPVASSVEYFPATAMDTQMQTAPLSYSVADTSYQNIARQAAAKYGINSRLFVRQIQQESGFNPRAYSPAGAEGIAQFMPATARAMGVNPWNPTSALYGGARLMSQLNKQFGGNYAKALAAYNAGSGAVQYATRRGGSNWLTWTPAETQHYVRVIMGW